MIYANPLNYVRAFEKENIDNNSTYPAHIVYQEGQSIPERIQDS